VPRLSIIVDYRQKSKWHCLGVAKLGKILVICPFKEPQTSFGPMKSLFRTKRNAVLRNWQITTVPSLLTNILECFDD